MTTTCQAPVVSYDTASDKLGVSYELREGGGYTSRVPTKPGARIRKAREARGWSLEDLGRESGVNRVTLNRIELDKQHPHKSTLKAIDRALSAPVLEGISDANLRGGARGSIEIEDRLADLIAYIKTLEGKTRVDFIRAAIALLAALQHAGPREATGTSADDDS